MQLYYIDSVIFVPATAMTLALLTKNDMTNATTTARFLDNIDAATKAAILTNIANHYGITTADAYDEVTDVDAEHLLDYVTGPQRAATSTLMQRYP